MPSWFVSEPFLSLWVEDVPLAYQPAYGPAVTLRLAYNPRHQPSVVGGYSSHGAQFGNGHGGNGLWACSLFSYAELSTDEYKADLLMPGGGWATFNFATNSNISSVNYRHNLTLEKAGPTGGVTNLILHYPDGSQANYGVSDTSNPYLPGVLFYVSNASDPAGNKTTFSYDANFYLTNVTAADATTFTFHYDDLVRPDYVTSITTSYGASVSFAYTVYGVLTNITDAAGLSSQFSYFDVYGDALVQLVTP